MTSDWEIPGDNEEVGLAPLMPMTHVRTTRPKKVNEIEMPWNWDVWSAFRRWGIRGMIMGPMPGKEDWYEILHDQDGSNAYYHYEELELVHDDDDDSDDGNGDDEGPVVGPDIVPTFSVLVKYREHSSLTSE
jgi:hypothetical protein